MLGVPSAGDEIHTVAAGPLQIRVFVLCMACLIMDGFDVQAMGYVAPAVLGEFGAERSVMGPVFAAANFGVLLGSLVFSMVADKIGRRPVIVWSTVFFSVMTIATAYAQTLEQSAWVASCRMRPRSSASSARRRAA